MAQGKSRTFIKTFLNVPRWIGVSQLAASAKSIKSMAKGLLTVQQAQFEETFEEAVDRMGLTTEDLVKKQKYCFVAAMVYLLAAIAMFIYMLHLINNNFFLASFNAAALTLLLLAFFFREHFWYTQIKNKRLGFTFQEWLASLFKI